MLDQLLEIVQQQAQGNVVDNNDVPNEHNEAVMQEASHSIFNGLQNMLNSGQTTELTAMLQGNKNPADDEQTMNMLSGDFINNITEKFGISGDSAKSIAMSLIPMVLSQLSNKAKDPNDSGIDFANILSSLRGGSANSGSAIDNIGGMLGLDKDKDGDVGIDDVLGMFK